MAAARSKTASAPVEKPKARATTKAKAEKLTNGHVEPETKSKAKTKASAKTTSKTSTQAPAKSSTKATATANEADIKAESAPAKKRGRDATNDDEPTASVAKKSKIDDRASAPAINTVPSEKLHVYVFGEGSAGELGLGAGKNTKEVKRPRLNALLEEQGVVQVTAGGMHALAITKDNKILSWGVNDGGALGRDTEWDGGLRDMDAAESDAGSDDSDEESGLNPKESTPTEVDFSSSDLPSNTRFVQVAAGDSISLALTETGYVYGWGQFRANEGVLGFSPEADIAKRPVLISGLKSIVSIRAGANHALALDQSGHVYAWGSGQQCQLGRRLIDGRGDGGPKKKKDECLTPRLIRIANSRVKIARIDTGTYHSFAITDKGQVYSWGLNNFGQTGHMKNAGTDDAIVVPPALVREISDSVAQVAGGSHHSIATTTDGKCLAFGRCDFDQVGLTKEAQAALPDDRLICDQYGKPRIVAAVHLTDIKGDVSFVAANSDHNIVVADGKAWAWGFSANYQTGLGTDEDVPTPKMIDNTAVREVKLSGSAAGGQFGLVYAPA